MIGYFKQILKEKDRKSCLRCDESLEYGPEEKIIEEQYRAIQRGEFVSRKRRFKVRKT